MPKSFFRKCSQLVRKIVGCFSSLYEDEGDLEAAKTYLETVLNGQNYLVRNYVSNILRKKYSELDL